MESFTSFDRNLEDDYYKILGCHETSTVYMFLLIFKKLIVLFNISFCIAIFFHWNVA